MKTWCIPPKASAEFVWHMEDVLQTYQLPYDPRSPVVCMDEASKQLIGEVNNPLPVRPGKVKIELDAVTVQLMRLALLEVCAADLPGNQTAYRAPRGFCG